MQGVADHASNTKIPWYSFTLFYFCPLLHHSSTNKDQSHQTSPKLSDPSNLGLLCSCFHRQTQNHFDCLFLSTHSASVAACSLQGTRNWPQQVGMKGLVLCVHAGAMRVVQFLINTTIHQAYLPQQPCIGPVGRVCLAWWLPLGHLTTLSQRSCWRCARCPTQHE